MRVRGDRPVLTAHHGYHLVANRDGFVGILSSGYLEEIIEDEEPTHEV
jgi:hypothetical protein